MGHNIVPDYEGLPTFGWIVAVLILSTIIFALGLRFMIERLRMLGRLVNRLYAAMWPTMRAKMLPLAAADLMRETAESEIFFRRRRRDLADEEEAEEAEEADINNANGDRVVSSSSH